MGSITGDETSEHSSACHKESYKILRVPIMPGTRMLWVRDFFCLFLNIPYLFAGFVLLGRCLPAIYCTTYYGFNKRMKEEQGLLIQQKKKSWMQQGLNL
jgi:hypothetical protein